MRCTNCKTTVRYGTILGSQPSKYADYSSHDPATKLAHVLARPLDPRYGYNPSHSGNAVNHARAAHSHDGGSCCRAADAPGGPGLSVAHDSCPSRPVGPHGGQATAQAPAPHTSWSAEGKRKRLHSEHQVTVLFRSAFGMTILTIASGAGVTCDAGVTRELARTCGPAIACGISPIAMRANIRNH